ncbi:MAG: hypothetical protein ACFFCW_24000 [Candidatus Hodarchaeota archaeon]
MDALNNMKNLKSSLSDLRELFERTITVKHIAEPLISFDSNHPADEVQQFMEERDYDVIGVRNNGLISGYARKVDLSGSLLGKYVISFEQEDLLVDTNPLLDVLERLRNVSRAFVVILGRVGGIVTRGDLQKTPVRMWLFGLISLIEMQLLRLIREYYPDDSWKYLISPHRLELAKNLLLDRKRRNEAIDLADCLQFGDKRDIVLKTEELLRSVGFESKKKGQAVLKDLEELRNDLAHAQEIIKARWPGVVELATKAEAMLRGFERTVVTQTLAA